MKYRLIKLDSLMEMEFASVEGSLSQIDERDLHSILPKGMTSTVLLEKVSAGEYLLATDFPTTPLLILPKKNLGVSKWEINASAESDFQPSALAILTQLLNMMGQGGSSASADSVGSNRGNLHPAKEPDYTPEPVLADSSTQAQHSAIAHEYNIEIAFSAKNPNHPVGLSTELFDKQNKMAIANWTATPTAHGTKYTLKTDSNAPHNLNFRATKNTMGLSLKDVAMVPLGSGKVNEAFLPIMPAVQFGERLGQPTTGYLYHFKGSELVQKYQWQDDGTFSPMPDNVADYHFRHASSALLVYWKIAGKVVKDQYLVYRAESLSAEEVKQANPEWLEKHGVHLDIDALLKVTKTPQLDRDNNEKDSIKADVATHTVIENPTTQERETWADIAKQYGLTAKALLDQNASYKDNPSTLKTGDTLTIQLNEAENPVEFERFECPPEAPSTYNNPENSHYACEDTSITITNNAPILPLEKRKVKKGLPLVNVKPERILRIGVFFDGTAQNNRNDAYKEEHGDKSRTNIARLFEAYSQELGKSAAIYVSGVGTVDGAWQRPQMIDAGKDESRLSGATGLYDDNGAFQKWQTLLKSLRDIIIEQLQEGFYDEVTHIAFDVFGFSRGAALARHFVNALKMGLPNYTKHRSGKDTSQITPNLLGTTEEEKYNPNTGYQADTQRSASVRFLGLFDTVGSFYLPGNKDNGVFNLHVNSADVGHALQICAHHEYRSNFPLTSLKTREQLAPNFYEEVFPGAHTDVGGGYPFVEQYNKTDLPKRYGIPINSTYNRELIKTLSYQDQKEEYAYKGRLVDFDKWFYQEQLRHQTEWSTECKATYKQHGKVEQEDATLYFYRLQPIDASLAGLAQERMKQQAERFGVEWFEHEYRLPHDYEDNSAQKSLWNKLAARPIGKIAPQDWLTNLPDNCIHRSHDSVINPGCSDPIDSQVNGIANVKAFKRYQPNAPLSTPTRETYDNE
ncbi:MAG: phospholipase effector Tle1 domain-containing protein [Marinomonas sp.]|uniref:phospholipase effector Tle1 domain-containing protein n=1 Tax=Marinomonas sp. TaxID=1904862 RepID=UPI003F97EEC2